MVKKKKDKLQKLVFCKKVFGSKSKVRDYINSHGYKLDKRLKRDVENEGFIWSVRQRNCNYFNKATFKCKKLCKGVKGVYGLIK